jgi:hypothetical protein
MTAFILFAFLALSPWGSSDEVPLKVLTSFRERYPEAEVSLWESGSKGFAATFNDEEGLKKAMFSPEGLWQETSLRILLRDIPTDVLREIRKAVGYVRLTYIGRVESPAGRQYRIESETENAVFIRIFDENGAPLSEESFPFSTGKA